MAVCMKTQNLNMSQCWFALVALPFHDYNGEGFLLWLIALATKLAHLLPNVEA